VAERKASRATGRRPRSPAKTTRAPGFSPAEGTTPEGPSEREPPICPVALCPVGMALTAANEVRPEVVEHLLLAGREVLLAVRALIDARLEGTDAQPRMERITIR
jgi:hypothetical protein